MTSRVGRRIGCFRAGIRTASWGKMDASLEKRTQYDETKTNCMTVRVAGISKVLRIDFEDVFVNTDVRYQRIQRIYSRVSHVHSMTRGAEERMG